MQWYLNKFWTVRILSLLKMGFVCSFSKCLWPNFCIPYGLVLAHVDCLSRYESRSPKRILIQGELEKMSLLRQALILNEMKQIDYRCA